MLTLVEQFKSTDGRKALVRSLRGMVILASSDELAEAVADRAEVVSNPPGTVLIREGGTGSDMYFVLSGRLQVIVKGREYALLGPGAHVGEFSLIDPAARRSATVRTLEETVTAKLSESDFGDIADRHPSLWHDISKILGSHLREGNRFLRRRNPRPHVFICASPVGRLFADAIQAQASDTEDHVPEWIVEAHCPTEEGSLEGLETALANADLGVIVLAPGEMEPLPEGESRSDHDALLLYCGISVGSLGRDRTVIVQPDSLADASPALALGISPFTYRLDPPEAIKSDLKAICSSLQDKIRELGTR